MGGWTLDNTFYIFRTRKRKKNNEWRHDARMHHTRSPAVSWFRFGMSACTIRPGACELCNYSNLFQLFLLFQFLPKKKASSSPVTGELAAAASKAGLSPKDPEPRHRSGYGATGGDGRRSRLGLETRRCHPHHTRPGTRPSLTYLDT